MADAPMRCVVDTNVATTANAMNAGAGPACVASSARALQAVVREGHVYIDDGGLIVKEYRANLDPRGQPGPGNAFLKWLLTHEWGGQRVTRVRLTPKGGDTDDFEELPAAPQGVRYDPSDRKFLAVAAAHRAHPPILQALDSKWWGWQAALAAIGVVVHFVCPDEIAAKHRQKMGP